MRQEPYQVLERQWAEFNGLDPAGMVACSSGTAALHLAFEVTKSEYGTQEVVMPDFSMVACPRAAAMAGMTHRFVDCLPNLLMDDGYSLGDATVEPYSTILAVHIYGRRLDMTWITSACGDNHVVIEDMAEVHGLRPHDETEAACWSFYRNKIVAGEEGGAVWFRDLEHAKMARQLRSLGFTDAHDFDHIPRGHNYRLANCLAVKILESMTLYKAHLRFRRTVEETYDSQCPADWRMPSREAPWVYDLRIPGMTANQQTEVVRGLQSLGIQARHAFKPMSSLREFRGCPVYGRGEALKASREVIYLPLTEYRSEAFPTILKILGK